MKFNARQALRDRATGHVRPHLFAGLGINVSTHAQHPARRRRPLRRSISPPYVAYNDRHGFNDQRQTSGGTSAGLLFDTRDNGINAQRGWLASAA